MPLFPKFPKIPTILKGSAKSQNYIKHNIYYHAIVPIERNSGFRADFY